MANRVKQLRREPGGDLVRLAVAVLASWLVLSGAIAAAEDETSAARPNILWISCEDISPHLGCYGDEHVITPHLDALADRGVRFTHAFTTCPVCATNRSSIITGMYPTTIGTHLMRCNAKLPEHIRCFTEYLREAGYHCSNNQKTDYNFAFPESAWDANSLRAHWRSRKPGQPFFHVRNFVNTHESHIWPRGKDHRDITLHLNDDQRRDPERLSPPPYFPDTPEARRDWANYYENITQMDYYAGQLLAQLEEDGLAGDTIVFFWSDHGMGMPRGKRWLYDTGTRVPLIVYVPERFRQQVPLAAGGVSDELVSFVDLAPTVLRLCGVTVPEHMQGRAFLGPDRGDSREFVISTRDRMDERYDMIRTVRTRDWRYTRNYLPWKPYVQWLSYAEKNATMKDLRRLDAAGELPAAARRFMARRKPVEELYHTAEDPYELENLAESPTAEHQAILQQMRARLHQWQDATLDLGFVPESELVTAEQKLGSRYALLRQEQAEERVPRLREVSLAAGDGNRSVLETGLASTDAAVRYWAVLGLGHLLLDERVENPDERAKLRLRLANVAQDESEIVRVAAGDILCQIGETELGLALLKAAMTSDNDWVRLTAVIALDELDESSRAVAEELRDPLLNDPQGYVQRVAKTMLEQLGID
ncbi:MAG: DUF229 domain-containing protein [Planctomycetota bacterium]|nr:MAG: DUF229 domain-containing protein [Planctomycetota bacterium]REK49092.1 MAG: DUF229 domain-containing protein [Planctomycetota bacterium]